MASEVVEFWSAAGAARWFAKDDAFDLQFRERFLAAHEQAARRELDHWSDGTQGTLALLILLDQFPRNAFRGSAHMYATDPLARHFAHLALERRFDEAVDEALRVFFYLPFEHAEDPDDQDLAVRLIGTLGREAREYAELHREIIRRFGRFPHRNAALARVTTPAEQAFLDAGGFAG